MRSGVTPAAAGLRPVPIRGCLAACALAALAVSASHDWRITPAAQAGARRSFPDTSTRIAILADQLPSQMSAAQRQFAATHYVGTQKLTLDLSRPLRAINPGFLVLHYRLAMWQSAPHVPYVVDGRRWGSDYQLVARHDDWFWQNASGGRVASSVDGKLLMNIRNDGFRSYWRTSLVDQVRAGDYDGVFFDSAAPTLIQGEARAPADDRLLGTGVRDFAFAELGGRTWIRAWEEWMAELEQTLAAEGIPLIPNVGAFVTAWDDTDYSLTAGVFSEGFGEPALSTTDWRRSVTRTLELVAADKIVILQNQLESDADLARRRYLLGTYLLVKGRRTYLSYFASSPLEWYPEWNIDLGPARASAVNVDDLRWNGVYRRDFARGIVLVNPTADPVTIHLEATLRRVEPEGGGGVPAGGVPAGFVRTRPISRIVVNARDAEILLR